MSSTCGCRRRRLLQTETLLRFLGAGGQLMGRDGSLLSSDVGVRHSSSSPCSPPPSSDLSVATGLNVAPLVSSVEADIFVSNQEACRRRVVPWPLAHLIGSSGDGFVPR
ncbi:hypothetical protein OPV22_009542 [Ensete ventricosum]|uniref:Uncharacterized protein n=1 Tax=Ensete ventricosum TaxID=4639 RepID=A0AAV8RB88_ENSVE|nr:hypothetical protein OPV22_009542 [Ensete ventricosum]